MLIDRNKLADTRVVRTLRTHHPLDREDLVLGAVEQQRAIRISRTGQLDKARITLREIDIVKRLDDGRTAGVGGMPPLGSGTWILHVEPAPGPGVSDATGQPRPD